MSATKSTVRGIWRALGLGVTAGAADDDPSGIATYSQAGAQFGFALTWAFMAAIQIMSACIGWQTRPPRPSTRWLWMQAPRASLRDGEDEA